MIKFSNLTLELHLVVFIAFAVLTIFFGYLMGRVQVAKLSKRLLEAENEMLHSNKEVLKYAEINKQLAETLEKAKIPLPSITKPKEEEKLRSIPLGKIG
jgi:guanylate kinase